MLFFTLTQWTPLCLLILHSAIATPSPLQADPPRCDSGLFGSPKLEDCDQAMLWIPKNKDTRVFAEPQFLNPPFNAVKNPFAPKAIVQLPKIFKYGSCHIALVLQPYGYPTHLKAEFRTKWSDIANFVTRLRPCLQPPRSGPGHLPQGGYLPLIITQSRPLGLYMYTTDSRFNNDVMTEYMVTGKAITPPNRPGLLSNQSENGYLSSFSLGVFNVSNRISSTPSLDLVSVS